MRQQAKLSRQDTEKPLLLIGAALAGIALNLVSRGRLTFLAPLVPWGVFLVILAVMIPVRIRHVGQAFRKGRATAIALATNFLVIPAVAWTLGWLLLRAYPDFWVAIILYTLTPCIGWYLIFTDLAEGDVAWGMALLPWNIVLQIVLMPFYMILLIGRVATLDVGSLLGSVGLFFLLPFALGWLIQRAVIASRGDAFFDGPFKARMGTYKVWALVLVIVAMFAGQAPLSLGSLAHVVLLIGVLLLFFALLFGLALLSGHLGHLSYEENVTLAFTTTARNSEAVIGIAVAAFPGHPLVYFAILVGPLVELPILLLLSRVLLRLRGTLWPSEVRV
jgi:ACR3 family arsenite transporter